MSNSRYFNLLDVWCRWLKKDDSSALHYQRLLITLIRNRWSNTRGGHMQKVSKSTWKCIRGKILVKWINWQQLFDVRYFYNAMTLGYVIFDWTLRDIPICHYGKPRSVQIWILIGKDVELHLPFLVCTGRGKNMATKLCLSYCEYNLCCQISFLY